MQTNVCVLRCVAIFQDYFVESTRGFKHFVAKVAIKDNLLYACTAQAKQKDYPEVEDELKRVVDSFRVPA